MTKKTNKITISLTPENRKNVASKLFMFMLEFVIVLAILSQISNPWIALLLGIILSYVFSLSFDILVKLVKQKLTGKISSGEKSENVSRASKEIEKNSYKEFAEVILSRLDSMPAVVLRNLGSVITTGESSLRFMQIKTQEKFYDLMSQYIDGKTQFDALEFHKAMDLLEPVMNDDSIHKFPELMEHTRVLIDKIPLLEEEG